MKKPRKTKCLYSKCDVVFEPKKENHKYHSEECRRMAFKENYRKAMDMLSKSNK